MFSFKEIISVTLILFSVIDILGNIPVIIELRRRAGHIQSEKATLVAGGIMILFLFLGESILNLLGLDVVSFAMAGAVVMFIIGLEMVLNVSFFKEDPHGSNPATSSIVPLAFPLLAGSGTMTTIISLRAEYAQVNVLIGIVVNLVLIYIVLKSAKWLERKLGQAGFNVIRKVFGIILLAIAIKLFRNAVGMG